MAHKKGQGSTLEIIEILLEEDLELRNLEVNRVIPGNIIIRQRGHHKVKPGSGVGIGKDHTIYASN